MRVLVVAAPLVGHLAPLLPLAGALRDAGHDVLLASGGDALRLDTDGLPLRDVARTQRPGRIIAEVALTHPRLAVREFSGRAGIPLAGHLFGGINDQLADDLVVLARRFGPDLVLHEPFAAAGALAAAVLGVPAVLQECCLWDGPALLAAIGASHLWRRAVRRHRADVAPSAATITIGPRSLVGPRSGRPLRAITRSGGGELPDWLASPGARPRVLVSRSTTRAGPGSDPTPAVIAAADRVDAEFVLVRGPRGRRLPPNVRVTGWIPLDRAMPHATAFVHHGGAGGLLQALAAGVPQLVLPGEADRRYNAELVARRGAGLAVRARRITPATLTRLIGDSGMRAAAAEVRAEIAAMPDPAALVGHLESVACSGPRGR